MKLKNLLIISALTSLSCFSMAANASWFSSDTDNNKIPTTLEGLLAVSETHVFSGFQFGSLPEKLDGEYAVIISNKVLAIPASEMKATNPAAVNLCRNAINATMAPWLLPIPNLTESERFSAGIRLAANVSDYCVSGDIQFTSKTAS
ncbi:hypothetical protein [Photobacterium carnosum]|uniref:hypothetical protein n=1 Tax=Photobacterium carnosum TaxID=2023717 RepID=UPI001E4927A2|nr:hypothetical protein [Photobacterium carnosum]MCD9538958.1 hypothetical protein [Photobacterium carnosum]MCF2163688.1 hypothetical protein [Photobacterium carnosum]MCF2307804.1 hypothetical protein [Photobacterium carnosum]